MKNGKGRQYYQLNGKEEMEYTEGQWENGNLITVTKKITGSPKDLLKIASDSNHEFSSYIDEIKT